MNKKIAMFCPCALIAIFVIPSAILAASFDCSKAITKTEKAICSDPTLSKLDEDMAAAYSKALKTSDPDAVKNGQRKWLKEILAPCLEDKTCIKETYENRLRQLGHDIESQSAAPPVYHYGQWSSWQLDCSRKNADSTVPCAAVRKRVCTNETTNEKVSCDLCGGQCKEEIADKKPPLYVYTEWSRWYDDCKECSNTPKPCKAHRKRQCVDRSTGKITACEFCGGVCKEETSLISRCNPDCKWTRVHKYSDKNCTDEIFVEQWGPQTNSPFNGGCSKTEWGGGCVKFGSYYHKWEPCVWGCNPPFKK